MLGITLFDNVAGLKSKDFRNTKIASGDIEFDIGQLLLDENFVVMQRNWRELVILSRRRIKAGMFSSKILTWIGLYSATPRQYDRGMGFYCGAGVWVLDSSVSGEAVLALLRAAVGRLYSLMEASAQTADWGLEKIELGDVGIGELELNQVIASEERLSIGQGLGHDTNSGSCFFDCVDKNGELVQNTVSDVQIDARFKRFNRVFISRDANIVADLRRRGRAIEFRESRVYTPDPKARGLAISGGYQEPSEGKTSSAQFNADDVYLGRIVSEVLRNLRREFKTVETSVSDNSQRLERGFNRLRGYLIALLVLSGASLVLGIVSAILPQLLGGPPAEEIVRSLGSFARTWIVRCWVRRRPESPNFVGRGRPPAGRGADNRAARRNN